jgi:hypothetical protein
VIVDSSSASLGLPVHWSRLEDSLGGIGRPCRPLEFLGSSRSPFGAEKPFLAAYVQRTTGR